METGNDFFANGNVIWRFRNATEGVPYSAVGAIALLGRATGESDVRSSAVSSNTGIRWSRFRLAGSASQRAKYSGGRLAAILRQVAAAKQAAFAQFAVLVTGQAAERQEEPLPFADRGDGCFCFLLVAGFRFRGFCRLGERRQLFGRQAQEPGRNGGGFVLRQAEMRHPANERPFSRLIAGQPLHQPRRLDVAGKPIEGRGGHGQACCGWGVARCAAQGRGKLPATGKVGWDRRRAVVKQEPFWNWLQSETRAGPEQGQAGPLLGLVKRHFQRAIVERQVERRRRQPVRLGRFAAQDLAAIELAA